MANFVYTLIPSDDYKETYEYGSLVVTHFDPEEITAAEGITMIKCAETAIVKDDYDKDLIQSEYITWKTNQKIKKLDSAKRNKIAEINAYDISDSVNSFSLNGLNVWLDKDTRVGLMNSTTIAKNLGNETTILWLNGLQLTINCDIAIQLLSSLEMYALECFNVTAQHKKEVEALTSVQDIESYDITKGYPDKLTMTI